MVFNIVLEICYLHVLCRQVIGRFCFIVIHHSPSVSLKVFIHRLVCIMYLSNLLQYTFSLVFDYFLLHCNAASKSADKQISTVAREFFDAFSSGLSKDEQVCSNISCVAHLFPCRNLSALSSQIINLYILYFMTAGYSLNMVVSIFSILQRDWLLQEPQMWDGRMAQW